MLSAGCRSEVVCRRATRSVARGAAAPKASVLPLLGREQPARRQLGGRPALSWDDAVGKGYPVRELRCVSGAPDPGHRACVDGAQAGKALRDLWLPRADLSLDVGGAVAAKDCGMVFV